MRLTFGFAVLVVGGISCLPTAYAWGAAGHEIVATIAQMYLHPNVLPTLCGILGQSDCHLAPFSTWADRLKYRMRWSAPLHYVGAVDDYPPNNCAYPGSNGWQGQKQINVLDGIKNVTGLLQDWVNHDASDDIADEALKFLIHFMGDLHQPLHLTGRERGGNSVKVLWDRRHTNLHSLWDGFIIAKALRNVPRNYSRPLPQHPEIEGALRGTIYDPFIRRIMWEGTLNAWADEVQGWLSCTTSTPEFSLVAEGSQQILSGLSNIHTEKGVEINPDGDVVCPYFWSTPLNALNCDIVWPKELTFKSENESVEEPLQLDTPEYAGVIEQRMLVEKLLAQGGIRLAGLLNYLFANPGSVGGASIRDIKA